MMIIWNNWKRLGIAISVVALVLLVNACALLNMQAEQIYYFGFMNKTGHDLDNVEARFGETLVARPGYLVKGGGKTEGPETRKIPTEAVVKWDENGQHHSVKTKLEGVVPKGFSGNGTIYFVITPDGSVQAKAIKRDDMAAWTELTKGLRPEGEYRFGFVNKTGHDMDEVSVFYGGEKVGGVKDIPGRARANFSYSELLTNAFPPEVELRWKQDGVEHSVKTKFEGVVPKGYARGKIFFVIKTGDAVEVHPIKWNDREGSINLVK